ncbi:hypothetical protein PHJA_001840400 [Phtheirospermum japonicum]|uniref:DUF641 domain-containing protein n=1 Tax=Phtheirospermum japonicum TaxID=374723 RepID=A0A830CMA5_9LAMI|nr:hypothetical protein PHJA_001840400 [Phtheirospermum japonicum]
MEDSQNRAFLAKLFAAVSSIKAAYAELQIAQLPYDNDAVQSADQAVVDELKLISELKRRFMKNQIGSSPPHVTLLLAEIQEQQSLMRIYEITMKKMQDEIENRARKISFLKEDLRVIIQNNRGMERKMNASGPFSVLDGVRFSDSNPNDFIMVLSYALRSVRNFVRFFIREMERASWDIQAAANSIQPHINFSKRDHKAFAFESFVCGEIFCGFNDPNFSKIYQRRVFFFEQFKKLRSASLIQFLRQNPNSLFGKFLKSKYLQFVHPKMEFSFFGNLNQRKKVMSSGEYPETEFFKVFAEMSRRVWLLHCLAFSFEHEVGIFQVEKNSKFSEVYMESVDDDLFAPGTDGEFRVAFTVVPGFKFHCTVVQSQVYLFLSG